MSRTLAELTVAEAQQVVQGLEVLSQLLIEQEVSLVLQRQGRLVYDGDLSRRSVSNISTSYPNAAYGLMDNEIRLVPQAALLIDQPVEDNLSSADYQRTRMLIPQVAMMCQKLASYDIPETLHHDDFHDAQDDKRHLARAFLIPHPFKEFPVPNPNSPVHWAARVRPEKLRRLYHLNGQGILDEGLIEEVGYGLYARCQSILIVSDVMLKGRVPCPQCGTVIQVHRPQATDMLLCPTCGWQTFWETYHLTFQHQELFGGGAIDLFQAYVDAWPKANSPRAKMLLIDQLIHAWHWQHRDDHILGRPAGVNLIEGSRQQVIALLDTLSET